MPQNAYVWQREWSPRFRQVVLDHGRDFAALDVLVAELSFRGAVPSAFYAKPDWQALLSTGSRIGIVVRCGPEPLAPGDSGSRAAAMLADACQHSISLARGAGIEPVELQLDLDAATSQLSAYRSLLHKLRARFHPLPLVLTVLPDWMRSADFSLLVGEADSYVLQVHSLERPASARQPFKLCDPVLAWSWIREASRLGIPFRVALPTYGYRVAFGPDGKFLGLQAEGPERAWPAGSAVRTVLADPGSMALLVFNLTASPPSACMGIVWFRMPGEDDRLAWHWVTLGKVMAGEPPKGHLVLEAPASPESLVELSLVNEGSAQIGASSFRVSWQGAGLVAADAIGGWRLERDGPSAVLLHPPAGDAPPLFPGERIQIGWMRLESPVRVEGVPLP
jgi:hypothetical protein